MQQTHQNTVADVDGVVFHLCVDSFCVFVGQIDVDYLYMYLTALLPSISPKMNMQTNIAHAN